MSSLCPIRRLVAVVSVLLVVLGMAGEAGAAVYRPDGMIRGVSEATFKGDGVYNRTGASQTSTRVIGARGRAEFDIVVQNDGAFPDSFRVDGSSHTRRFSVRYTIGGRNVTSQVKAGRYVVGPLAAGAAQTLRVHVATRVAVPKGSAITVRVQTRSIGSGGVDVTQARVARPLYSANQVTVRNQINATRASFGLSGLTMHRRLANKAQLWAQHLAAIGQLQHSNLASGVPSNWQGLAENVGYYTNLVEVHQNFVASPEHRANILGRYNYVGTGVAARGQWLYVVHVFMRA